jgi:tetratricopeptide (TPR) repeat protein
MASKARPKSTETRAIVVVLVLAAIGLAAYWPSLSGGFVFDDDTLVTKSSMVQAANGLYRMWLTTEPLDYWPLTNTSFWFEWRLWGLQPTGYHVTNLVLHVASGVLLWAILRRLSIPGAFLASALFVVHPVNVESVAWIAQRKNTLSMVLMLGSLWCYLRADPGAQASPDRTPAPGDARRSKAKGSSARKQDAAEAPSAKGRTVWYGVSLVAFLLAMLSKGSVAILPLVLLVIVWWQRRAVTLMDFVRTAPFFAIAGVLTIVNIWFQNHYMTGDAIRDVTIAQRIIGAAAIVWFYLSKAVLPIRLMFLYPQWSIQAGDIRWWLPLVALIVVTGLLWWQRASPAGRAMLTAWACFIVGLLPVMGLTDVYFMKFALVADHYQYIAMIAVLVLVAAGVSAVAGDAGERQGLSRGVGIALVAVLIVLSWRQSRLYADAETLYRATLAENPSSWLIHNDLALLLVDRGDFDEAAAHFHESVRLDPRQIEAHNNLCHTEAHQGHLEEAVKECGETITLISATLAKVPELPSLDETRRTYRDSLKLAHNDRGGALAMLGRSNEALPEFEAVVRLDPEFADGQNNLANVLLASHRESEAIDHYRDAIRLQPGFATAHNNLGLALERLGRTAEAIREYEEALKLDPSLTRSRSRLAALTGK